MPGKHLSTMPLGARSRIAIALLLVLALIISLIPMTAAKRAAEADEGGDTVQLVRTGEWIEYDGYRTADMHDAKTGAQIICAQPAKDSPESGKYKKNYSGIDEHIESTQASAKWVEIRKFLARALMFYTHPDSPGFDKTLFPSKNWEGGSWSRKDYIAALHLGISTAFDNSFKAATLGTSDSFKEWAVKNITGGFAGGDSIDGRDLFFPDSIWGKLLNAEGSDVAKWKSDSNPYYKELPEGFKIYLIQTGTGNQVCFGFNALGWAAINKQSALANVTASNRAYSFTGALYRIYADEACTDKVGELSIGPDASAKSLALEPGTYYVKEAVAPHGYLLDAQVHKVKVAACETAKFTSLETPQYYKAGVILRKLNAETGTARPAAGASLEGARFEISYFDEIDADTGKTPCRSWTFSTDSSGEIKFDSAHLVHGDKFFVDANEAPVLPLGTYSIKEVQAPEGYLPSTKTIEFTLDEKKNASSSPLKFENETEFKEQVVRGDFEFRKTDDHGNSLAGIPFKLSYNNDEDGRSAESHIIVTDENGQFSSAGNAHSHNTNANDQAVGKDEKGTWLVDEEKLDAGAGTWFSMDASGKTCAPNDELGALPYGSYMLEELPCTANHGKTLITAALTISKDESVVKLNNLIDKTPAMQTSAVNGYDGTKRIPCSAGARVLDTVRYENLNVGKTYLLHMTLRNAQNEEALTDADGNVLESRKEFTATRSSGAADLSIDFDASRLAGMKVVVFEELLLDGVCIASHCDIDAESQMVEVLPRIATKARDKADGDSYVTGESTAIVDAVSYEGLQPGKTYKLDARLVDKATENTARNEQGNAVSGSKEFTPGNADGNVEVEIKIDAAVAGGHDVVVYEKLLDEHDTVLASHEDIDNLDQTVKTVGMDTVALDASDKDHVFASDAKQVRVVDSVTCSNLETGKEYCLEGVLADADTGKAIRVNGRKITSTKSFVAGKSSCLQKVRFSFSPKLVKANTVVVYETLKHNGVEIASHADAHDEDQTLKRLVTEEVTVESKGSETVKTGDEQKLPAILFIMLGLALTCAGASALYRRRGKRD